MNQAKLDKTINGLTTIAKKVYECVPKQEEWTSHKIQREMERKGFKHEKRVVDGCLNSLVDSRLIKEIKRGHFMAVVPSQKATLKAVSTVIDKNPVVKNDPVDRISQLAISLKSVTESLIEMIEELELVALSVSDEIEAADSKNGQLSQLKSLLKEIAD